MAGKKRLTFTLVALFIAGALPHKAQASKNTRTLPPKTYSLRSVHDIKPLQQKTKSRLTRNLSSMPKGHSSRLTHLPKNQHIRAETAPALCSGNSCIEESIQENSIASAHKARVVLAREKAMATLMRQLGKPYRWGGASPLTGFDCSGLVYYAYKDLLKIPIPRTANEMYHLRDAPFIAQSELQRGDLVFFRIQGRGAADHVGVYLGNGKFIQSPRTGKDIRITSLNENYWQQHYVGARRVMMPHTLR
ncbi:C40 family peptidase [Erwinia sp. HR93]|uniref:C40 family peptidase n=1 Tax=Erwinia sp. HR93 TaxID=3094840 RepID=UPI002ADEC350|nr:C40 family peptidase [Erwinia sp. HR93]MEA1065111.1 C40 family peptidase [Erwinia sp. HR93]